MLIPSVSVSGARAQTAETVRDEFTAISYSGNDGTVNWSTDWLEAGEAQDPTAGVMRVMTSSYCVAGNCLRIGGDEVDISGKSVSREASLVGAASARLSYAYRRRAFDEPGGSVAVQVSGDGGGTWVTLDTHSFTSTDGAPVERSCDISSYIANNTRVRFLGSGTVDYALYVDNVQIRFSTAPPGVAGCTEGTAPAAISDLAAGAATTSTLELTWTAPGDDGNSGTAAAYDIRYSTSPITAANWNSATQVAGEPAPLPAGSAESFTVTGLSEGATYYFAIKTLDEVPNESPLSNVATAATVNCHPTNVAELRAALATAACPTVTVAPGTYLLTTSGSGHLTIDRGVTVLNAGGGRVVIDAGGVSRVFFIKDVATPVTLNDLTITGGFVSLDGGGIYIEKSTVTVTGSTVSGNSVAAGKLGGGIFTKTATLQLTNVTVSGNSAPGGGWGGGIYQEADFMTLTNTTVSGNVAGDKGGGIYNKQGTLTIRNALVADNTQTTGDQIFQENATINSNGNNLVEGGCAGCSPSDLVSDPLLGPLADNGGDSYTQALLTGSPAINAALAGDAPATDQRGIARPQGAESDIGAFELQAGAPPSLSSAANQSFWVGKAPTAIGALTVTDAPVPVITATNDIRVRIPAGFNMSWDAADLTATVGGSAAGKVSTTVAYEDAGKTLVVDVTTDFASGDQITISDLAFVNFTATSGTDNLELEVYNDGAVTAEDDKTIEISAAGTPTISSQFDQSFRVGSPPISMSTLTVIDDASKPVITAANDIRVRIPAGFNMTWDTSDNTATILGTAMGKVSTTVSYEDGGKTLVIDVTADFAAGDMITIANLSFTSFTAASPDDNLELEVLNDGTVAAEDDKIIFIVLIVATPSLASAADQLFTVGDPPTEMVILRITDDPVPTITATGDLRIHIPPGISMIWDTLNVSPTISGRGRSKVSTTVSYEDNGKTMVIDVLTNFGSDDWLNIKKVNFLNFASATPTRRLELDINNDGIAETVDLQTKQILGPSYGVYVTPATTAQSQLPSNGTNYTVDFSVANIGSITDDYDLLTTTIPGSAISVISITGPSVTQGANPDSARLSGLASAGVSVVTVTYSVADVALGTTDTLIFTARSVGNPAASDDGRLELTVVRPNVTTSKAVDPAATPPPGTDLTYTITVTNVGSANAVNLVTVDSLATEVQFQVGSVVNTLPAGVGVVVEYSNDDGATWTYTPVSNGCGAPATYDDCVTHIRWTLQNDLSSVAPDNTGEHEFVARVK